MPPGKLWTPTPRKPSTQAPPAGGPGGAQPAPNAAAGNGAALVVRNADGTVAELPPHVQVALQRYARKTPPPESQSPPPPPVQMTRAQRLLAERKQQTAQQKQQTNLATTAPKYTPTGSAARTGSASNEAPAAPAARSSGTARVASASAASSRAPEARSASPPSPTRKTAPRASTAAAKVARSSSAQARPPVASSPSSEAPKAAAKHVDPAPLATQASTNGHGTGNADAAAAAVPAGDDTTVTLTQDELAALLKQVEAMRGALDAYRGELATERRQRSSLETELAQSQARESSLRQSQASMSPAPSVGTAGGGDGRAAALEARVEILEGQNRALRQRLFAAGAASSVNTPR